MVASVQVWSVGGVEFSPVGRYCRPMGVGYGGMVTPVVTVQHGVGPEPGAQVEPRVRVVHIVLKVEGSMVKGSSW